MIRTDKKAVFIILALLVLTCAFSSCVKPEPDPPITVIDDPNKGSETQNPPDNPDDNPPPVDPNAEKQPDIAQSHNSDGLLSEWNALMAIAKSGQNYYSEYFSKTRLITKNGQLYNKAAEMYIDVAYLYNDEGLSQRYKDVSADVLLIYPSDLAEYLGSSVAKAGNNLTVYAAMKHPSQDKYIIASASSRCGFLTSGQYRELFAKYSQSHGAHSRIELLTDEYTRIITFIRMYEGKYEDYYVRSVYADDKYALATFSIKSNPSSIKQYILKKDEDFWSVIMTGIESEARPIVAINKKIPDFNLDMLPRYAISDYEIITNFSELYQIVLNNKYVETVNDIVYSCGTTEYCYFKLADRNGLLIMKGETGWEVSRVSGSEAAEKLMLAKKKDAPVFILPDEYY